MKPRVFRAPSSADYRALVARLLEVHPLQVDGVCCVYLPSFSPEVALTLKGRALTVASLRRSAWAHLCFLAGNPLEPVHAVEPAQARETFELSTHDAAQLMDLLPMEEGPASFGLDGMSLELSWRRDGVGGGLGAWVGCETPASLFARRLIDSALARVEFDASRDALSELLRYFS